MNNNTKARKYNAKRANRGKARTRSRRQRNDKLARIKRVCAGGSLMIELRPAKVLEG